MIRWIAVFLLLSVPVRAADLTVLSVGAMRAVAAGLAPAFEARTGSRIILRNDTADGLLHRIAEGEPFDMVLMSPAGLEVLATAGKIAPGSIVRLAQVGIGVGIMTGSPRPDISTVLAFKTAMLHTRAVAYVDPRFAGSSSIYIPELFQTLGIADAMVRKAVLVNGGLAAIAVLDGRAEIVLQQISEVIAVPGITLVGPLPAEIQIQTIYAGAIASATSGRDTARAFLTALSGPAARPLLAAQGMTAP